jgi:hypothetical protein
MSGGKKTRNEARRVRHEKTLVLFLLFYRNLFFYGQELKPREKGFDAFLLTRSQRPGMHRGSPKFDFPPT